MKGFKEFLLRGNVVDLAVAVVIGTAFTAVVTSLVANLFTPLIAAIIGKPDFAQLTFTINNSVFYYGRFLNSLIAFLSIAAVIYFVVVAPVSRINERRRRGQTSPLDDPTLTDETRLLTEIRDLLAAGRR
ncbi:MULTISPECIES: large conductance mechanosensitive channel protein MscL [Parafrankia]|uniref:large conductance mechanosensitive channel protein MscL n=1 Tax=Parafrankia TaxID=2994362 RepID=UPI00015DA095|nr:MULTISPECIES: large conductance mechanosensitive channel protein MscL [Parafrankia]ABW16557.1 large conductance mechanosensitive channel protein [Frankia sp. EAN1pec]TCJ35458.1 large conductance mechanosensitive channel protein MscL [Parafrankia sp. BMG5.11]SQD99513.1 Large-conductance mechanosensitive channel [Parafrankia sp. Ea1.12]